jgi:hypothetical protein
MSRKQATLMNKPSAFPTDTPAAPTNPPTIQAMNLPNDAVLADLSVAANPTAPTAKIIGPPMRVLESRVYRGPNPYGYRPVVRFKIDLGRIEQHPSDQLDGFTDRLLELMPTLGEHGCSYGVPGGFVRRMREGTWIAHVAEHVAIELQCLAGTPVTYGKTRQARDESPGVYNVVYSFKEERVGLLAGWLALRVVNSLLPTELQGVEGLNQLLPRDGTPPLADPGIAVELPARTGRADPRRPAARARPDHAEPGGRGAPARHSGHPTGRIQLGATRLRQVPAAHSGERDQQEQPYRASRRPATSRSRTGCSPTRACPCRKAAWSKRPTRPCRRRKSSATRS